MFNPSTLGLFLLSLVFSYRVKRKAILSFKKTFVFLTQG
ncbi:PEP-CTERM sorting domain-containing protein [Lactococcus lactis]